MDRQSIYNFQNLLIALVVVVPLSLLGGIFSLKGIYVAIIIAMYCELTFDRINELKYDKRF